MPALYIGTNPQPTAQGVIVGCTNRSYMCATATDTLDLPQLPAEARECHKLRNISLPLISVPKLCRAGCKDNFHQNTVTIIDHRGTELITGVRDPTHNLYIIKVPMRTPIAAVPTPHPTAAGAYTLCPAKDLIQYFHATAGFPT